MAPEPDPETDPPGDDADDSKYVTHDQLDGKIDPLSDKIDKILSVLGTGKNDDPADPPAGKSIAEQVREGVEQLEAERAAKATADKDAADAKAAKETTEERLARLERKPREPAGKVRTAVQRWGLGMRETGR